MEDNLITIEYGLFVFIFILGMVIGFGVSIALFLFGMNIGSEMGKGK